MIVDVAALLACVKTIPVVAFSYLCYCCVIQCQFREDLTKMGKTSKWLRNFLTGKKGKEQCQSIG